MAKRHNVVRFCDFAPPYRRAERMTEPATVYRLPTIVVERPPRPRLTPSQRLKSLRSNPDYSGSGE